MIYLASHHAVAEVVCNSLKPPVEKGATICLKSAFVLSSGEMLVCAGRTACASWLPQGRHTQFHEPGTRELCVCTVYHWNSSQYSGTPCHPYALACRVHYGLDIHPVPQRGRRMFCPPERLPLTPCFTSNIVSHFRCAEQNTAFVSKS